MIFLFLSLFTSWNLFANSTSPSHALYISVIEITHPVASNTNQIKIKVFQDDLQNALKNAYPNDGIRLGDNVYPKHSQRLSAYFDQHFVYQINGQKQELVLKTCEAENDVFWISFESQCPSKWASVSVKADFFMELFPTQSNVVRINDGGNQRFMRLVKGNEEGSDTF